MTRRYLTTLAVLVAIGAPQTAWAQEVPSDTLLTVNHFLDWEHASDPQISPDTSQIVYTRWSVNKRTDRWDAALWLVNTDGTKHRFLVGGREARWSPDGTRIAYLARDGEGRDQIFVRWMDAEGAVSQVTRVNHAPWHVRWSPDGENIVFLMLVPSAEEWNISLPAPPAGAQWTTPPRITRRMHYRKDGVGFVDSGYDHLFTVPADGGTPRQLTSGAWNVGARTVGIGGSGTFDFTPDGTTLVFDGLMEADADLRYRESHIYALELESGEIQQLTRRRGPWTNPVVSPDGRRIAFVGYDWTPQTYRARQVYVMDRDGSNMRSITGQFDRDPQNITWHPESEALYFHADDSGARNVHLVHLNGNVRAITEGSHVVSLGTIANGLAVGLQSAHHAPADVVRFRLGVPSEEEPQEIVQLTQLNQDILGTKRLGAVEEIRYISTEETPIQGWVVKPPAFDSTLRYPLILEIHDGPHAMYDVGFNYSFQNFAANGFVVLYTNPRGSSGYGTAFGNAIDNGFPSVDYADLMAGVDSLLARGFIDPNRLYVTGCGAGGVLASWIIGQTDRFAAAAVRCPVVNWISFSGTTDITLWGYHRYGGFPWDNPEKWLRHSPLMNVAKIKTPTLLMVGEHDLRTPVSQTEEFYKALKALGVSTALMRFADEYHGTESRPSNFMRTQLYIMSWFNQHDGTARASAGVVR